jgi:hypothetical protein
MKAIEVLATIFTVVGYFLLSEKMLQWGFMVSIIANLLWICWSLDKSAWGIMTVNSLLLLSAVNGLL